MHINYKKYKWNETYCFWQHYIWHRHTRVIPFLTLDPVVRIWVWSELWTRSLTNIWCLLFLVLFPLLLSRHVVSLLCTLLHQQLYHYIIISSLLVIHTTIITKATSDSDANRPGSSCLTIPSCSHGLVWTLSKIWLLKVKYSLRVLNQVNYPTAKLPVRPRRRSWTHPYAQHMHYSQQHESIYWLAVLYARPLPPSLVKILLHQPEHSQLASEMMSLLYNIT